MLWLIAIGIIFACIVWSIKDANKTIDVQGRSVFISGCDSGFGHDLALRLDNLGLLVFAGCLTSKGAEDLQAQGSSNLRTFVCDITKREDIENAVKIVSSASPSGLWALVNNAGIAYGGEWDWFQEKLLRQIMEVNFFAHVAVTQAFLAQLKKTKGRIVNLSSVAGIFAGGFLGAYSCSKFAMEAFSDSLRREMPKWGISVYVVEPGFMRTPMVTNSKTSVQKAWNAASEEKKQEYGAEYERGMKEGPLPPMEPPEYVIDALQAKIITKNPALRSRVGKLANVLFWLQYLLPTSWVDMLFSKVTPKLPLPEVLAKKLKQN